MRIFGRFAVSQGSLICQVTYAWVLTSTRTDNPYAATNVDEKDPLTFFDVVQRVAAVVLYLLIWELCVYTFGTLLSRTFGT